MPQASVSTWRAERAPRWPEALLAALLALWAAAVLIPEVPWARVVTLGRSGMVGDLIVPGLLAAALALRPQDRRLLAAVVAAGIVLAADALIPWVAREPGAVLGAPLLLAVALLAARYPVVVLGLALGFAAFPGTLTAHTAIPPRIAADGCLLALALAIGWGVFVRRGSAQPLHLGPAVWILAAYVVASLLAAIGAPDTTAALQGFRQSQFYMLAALLVCAAGWDEARRARALKMLIAVNLAVVAYAVFRDIAGPSEAERNLALATLRQYNLVDGELRLIGGFITGVDLAHWTVVGAPLCAVAALALRGPWRWIALVTAAASVYVLAATGVRTAVVGLIPAMLLVIVLYALGNGFRGPRLLVAGGALMVFLIGGGVTLQVTALASPNVRERFERLLDPGSDDSLILRRRKWEAAIDEAGDRPFGSGLGTSGVAAIRYGRFAGVNRESIDSAYLKVFVEQGPVGTVLFVAALLALLATLVHAATRARGPTTGILVVGAAAMLTSAFVIYYAGVFSEGLTSMHGWLLLGLGLSAVASPDPT